MFATSPRTCSLNSYSLFFFFNDTATPEIYTLSLHDAFPISVAHRGIERRGAGPPAPGRSEPPRRGWPLDPRQRSQPGPARSEEHTSELQSRRELVCRLLLEKKKRMNCDALIPTCI